MSRGSFAVVRRIVVLNPKGGSGKTTIATNLAASYAFRGYCVALIDYDSQGSSTRWLSKRPDELPAIHGVANFQSHRYDAILCNAYACISGEGDR